MIPRRIHYCWFGKGEKPKLAKKCIESWKKYCPDYEIIEWNESNFDINLNAYTKMCYEQKKWAFLSDYVRLWVVEKFGGFYFDTDVELIRPLESICFLDAFIGFESNEYVASGLGFGADAHHPLIKNMLNEYSEVFMNGIKQDFVGCPILNTNALVKRGLSLNGTKQIIDGATIFPMDYLNPYDDATGQLKITENTISIHWYAKSALSNKVKIRSKITRPFHRIFGKNCFEWIKKILHKFV